MRATLLFLLGCCLFIPGGCYSLNSKRRQFPTPSPSSNRRRDVVAGLGLVSSLLPWYPSLASPGEAAYERLTTATDTAHYIRQFCNAQFLSCVVESEYEFLYRGLSSNESDAVAHESGLAAIIITDEPHDLLNPDTYQSNEAASYFSSLEKEMTAKRMSMKPSNSHLGTTCAKEAALWGTAASIWPLGEKGVGFAWLKDGGVFWPNTERNPTKKRSVVSSSTHNSNDRGVEELSHALQGDAWEIMFRVDNGFLAVPAALDKELRTCLMEMK